MVNKIAAAKLVYLVSSLTKNDCHQRSSIIFEIFWF